MADCSPESVAIDLLRAAHHGGRKLTGVDLENAVVNFAAAYRIQDAVTRGLGPVGAFKTGRKSADETPIMAPILADRVRHSPARFSRSELGLVGIELEVACGRGIEVLSACLRRTTPAADGRPVPLAIGPLGP